VAQKEVEHTMCDMLYVCMFHFLRYHPVQWLSSHSC